MLFSLSFSSFSVCHIKIAEIVTLNTFYVHVHTLTADMVKYLIILREYKVFMQLTTNRYTIIVNDINIGNITNISIPCNKQPDDE